MKKPGFSYGWVIVAISFITLAIVYGSRYSFSVFYVAILQDFGWSRASTALIYSLSILVYGLAGPFAGALLDRFGPRKVLPVGVLLLSLGMAAAGRTEALWHFYLLLGVVMALGTALTAYGVHSTIISRWFAARKATAIGIAGAGIGLGYPMVALVEYLISHLGWRDTYTVMGVFIFVTLFPLVALFHRSPPEYRESLIVEASPLAEKRGTGTAATSVVGRDRVRREWTLAQALRTGRFWWLFFAWFGFHGIGLSLLLAHQIAFAVDLGYSRLFAAGIFGLFGIMDTFGYSLGFLSDRIGREKTYTIATVSAIVGVLFLLGARDASQPWLLYLYAIFVGLSAGLVTPTATAAVADLFGGKHFGSINGFIMLGFGVGGALGPWLGGLFFDWRGNYYLAFLLPLMAFPIACVAVWVAAPRRVRAIGKGQGGAFFN